MRLINEHSGRFAVALLLSVVDFAESTYYKWVKRAEQPCDRNLVDLGLLSNIYDIWEASGRTSVLTASIGTCAATASGSAAQA